jgi:choline dehydrogenase-like flavoprotein
MPTVTKHYNNEAQRGNVLARSYDYVIVGAGSAGCVVARRLIDGTAATVLVLEAGGSDEGVKSISNPPQWVENIGSQYDWNYSYEPSPRVDHRSLHLALGKVLGGGGSINALAWARGNRADFDAWAKAGNAGWDFNSVLPLFKKSEEQKVRNKRRQIPPHGRFVCHRATTRKKRFLTRFVVAVT